MKHKNQIYILLFIVLVAFIGITIPIPILTPLFLQPENHGVVPLHWGHGTRSIILGITIAVYPFGQFIGSPILGRLSDQHGRKLVLICTLFGAGIGYLITAFALYYKFLLLLIISRLLTGFLEGNIAIARAAIIDLDEINKHKNFGKISAAATIGRIIGPLLGGFFVTSIIIKWFDFYLPFLIGTIIFFCTAIVAVFLLKESLPILKRTQSLIKKCNYKITSRINEIGCNYQFKSFLIIWIFITFAIDMFGQFFPAFLVGKWQMTPMYISFFITTLSIWYVIGSIWLVPYLSRKIKTTTAIIFGMLFFSLSLFFMLIPNKSYFLFPIFAFCDLAVATVFVNFFVLMSNLAKQEHQGEAMGIVLGLRTLTDSIIGLFGGLLIALSPIIPIVFSAFIGIIIFLIMWITDTSVPKPIVLDKKPIF